MVGFARARMNTKLRKQKTAEEGPCHYFLWLVAMNTASATNERTLQFPVYDPKAAGVTPLLPRLLEVNQFQLSQ
eukprot:5660654-Amphidinium_carterae.1